MNPPSDTTRNECLMNLDRSVTDVVFIINDEEIKAHKSVLRYSSPVFEKMLYGKLASSRIIIKDIELEDFNQMLEFIYTHQVRIKSLLNAWSLFYIAHKYLLNDFANVVVSYIQRNLCLNNLLLNYEYAEMYGITKLERVCMNEITLYVRGIFQSNMCDYHMKPSTMAVILSQRFLNISNNDLISQVLFWAIVECDLNNVKAVPSSIIHLLKSINILQYLINLDFTSTNLEDPCILSTCQLIKQMKNDQVPYKKYSEKHWCTFCLCRHMYKIAKRVNLISRDVLISNISVNQKIVLFGLVVTTEVEQVTSQPYKYNGSIQIEVIKEGSSNPLVVTIFSKCFLYETPVYIPLAHVIYLERDVFYKIKISFTNFDKESSNSSVICNYMSCELKDEKRQTLFTFDELDGSVIRGLCYYPF